MTDHLPIPSFRAWIEAKKLVLDDPDGFGALVAKLDGERVTLTLKKFRRGRSLNANAYYWAILAILQEFCGYEDAEELHNGLKAKFLVRHEDGPIATLASTARLDTMQFSDYVEKVRQLAAELGCVLPDPGEF